jgi:hypothetical protein
MEGATVPLAPRLLARGRFAPATIERAAVVLALGLLGALMCGAHIAHGGLYFDDWPLLALARFPPPGGELHGLWIYYGQRPGQVLYYDALNQLLGANVSARLALAAAAVVFEALCLYLLLRELRLRARDAFAICALALLFPFSDSAWLWSVVSLTTLSVALGLLGVLLALRAFRARGARALFLHGSSLALYLASVLSYEVFAVAGCLAGLLYARAVGLRRTRARWALDVALIGGALFVSRDLLPVDVATPSRMQSLPGTIAHAGLLLGQGALLAGRALLALHGVSPWIGLALLAAVLGAALVLRALPSTSPPARREIGRLLGIAGAGALVAVAGWAVYAPAPDHYSPLASGTVNRMNVLAAVGVVMVLYACICLAAAMLARVAGASEALVSTCVICAALALGGAYAARTRTNARAWDRAAADQRALLARLHVLIPHPPRSATIYVGGAPRTIGPGIPVLDTQLDLTSAIRISYDDPTLTGVLSSGNMINPCCALKAGSGWPVRDRSG